MTETTPARDWRAELEEANAKRRALLEKHGITMSAVFVPWSQSRSKNERDERKRPVYSLNWKVTILKRNTAHGPSAERRPIFTTDYGAGIAHCPAYSASLKELGARDSITRMATIRWECEHGKQGWSADGVGVIMARHGAKTPDIMPNILDVVASLLMDGDAIEYGTFEEWAPNLGYDTDSRKAEATYRACLGIGLKLRAALGDQVLAELREAFQGY